MYAIRSYYDLNYGHTLGHAVENLAGYGAIKHGEAVAIGMVAAARISETLGLCNDDDISEIVQLLEDLGLPVDLPKYS